MKSTNFRNIHSKKEATLNYPMDSDKKFCKRCLDKNIVCQQPKGCPFDHKKENVKK